MTALPLVRRFTRRSQTGQSIVILALGFIALLAFVGIVTDVSLMFVRFSQLTRAVDSASIAAAGQVRRQVPNAEELVGCPAGQDTPDNPCQAAENKAFARSFATIGIAARQFVEFYGLNPQSVKVDMCATVSMLNTVPDPDELAPINADFQQDFDQLCTDDQRKLIKVTAQVNSPTVFLRLLGFGEIPLTASSISETAVLDVVVIMDVSESMLNETTYRTWADRGYTNMYIPPYAEGDMYSRAINPVIGSVYPNTPRGFADFWQELVIPNTTLPGDAQFEANSRYNYADATHAYYVRRMTAPGYSAQSASIAEVREDCRVRFFPNARNVSNPSRLWRDATGWTGGFSGFVPTYDYFACCNDPDGNGSFADLLCEPFKSARDATEDFIRRIDFLRGDRVAFVTYDRRASIIYVNSGKPDPTQMIESEDLAIQTLRQSIGVRAEPTFYTPSEWYDSNNDGIANGDGVVVPWDTSVRSQFLTDHDYPAKNNCPFYDAALEYPFGSHSSPTLAQSPIYPYNYDPLVDDAKAPFPLQHMKTPYGAMWDSYPGYDASLSYDYWASCTNSNVGAALREAGNALLRPQTRRTEGSVWVMVFLGDGAAGGSDPIGNNGRTVLPDPADYPYSQIGLLPPFHVTYGAYGACPAGIPGASELVDTTEAPYGFPICSDEVPETRHFCYNPTIADSDPSDIDVRNAGYPTCETEFDVDDYARDWADFITGVRDVTAGASQSGLSQLPTIFTIGFGLNFQENIVNGVNVGGWGTTRCMAGSIQHDPAYTANTTRADIADCLGEELMRYIADVGDNFQLDTDYQQALRDNQNPDLPPPIDREEFFGVRGPCEEPENLLPIDRESATDIYQLILPKPAGDSCGNYFNAPNAEELNKVFNEITSRMFTRLTR
jgi:Putative Flp pilus-assembly TadE/G-like